MYPMKKIRLLVEYDGTAYHGWQVQKDTLTVQGILEEKVLQVTGSTTSVIGASRTDAGVHAFGQVAVFRTQSRLDAGTIRRALNAVLPLDIRILAAEDVHDAFHPREDADRKRYFYVIANQRTSSAFLYRYTWIVPQPLGIGAMEESSRVLIGRHPFSAFMGTGSDIQDTVREIYSLNVEKMNGVMFMGVSLQGNFIRITAEANGFLRHMVRNIVGTLVEIGRGKLPSEQMGEILKSGDRKKAGQTAPANGLFLERIYY
jgi:tRNA pseudouridine38-40 synthase